MQKHPFHLVMKYPFFVSLSVMKLPHLFDPLPLPQESVFHRLWVNAEG